ncbi:uncharacterized protein J7T54_005945 [Emericellopsis cladophorae]|uniref:MGS207 protein n=1 Tax=Emericellopsis cladophorae TaxID=2686198 RepID=A0A9P9Y8W4_9HYPO|nr:uncharacterized protein J7T54_005945 [Emericellopsis cladophorae]KAI6785611.1 hypothetical protein J7T54_005945 [Emericellopsis cladophorae]
MSGILSYLTGTANRSGSINLPSVEIHNVETNPDRRARCLKHLLKANHVNYSVVYHNLQYDNHNPHILCSAYLLGADQEHLNHIYDEQIKPLESWRPSPAELNDLDWRDFLGDKNYQRAYLDYFEDKLAMEFSYDWKKVVEHFMFEGDQPLYHGLICGLGHPLIHLGYAYEMDNKELAMEALALTSVQRCFLNKYLDDKAYTKPSSLNGSPLELLNKMCSDKRFGSLPKNPEFDELESILEKHEDLVLEYWNGWNLDDPQKQFELSQEAAVALLVATVRPGTHSFNFVLVHLLTTSHAVRILLPCFPKQHRINLVREWWLLVIAMFIMKGRPTIDPDNVEKDIKQKHWGYVEEKALKSPYSTDAHYVKAIRAMKEAARTWGDVHEQYLRAAVTFVDNFHGWTF